MSLLNGDFIRGRAGLGLFLWVQHQIQDLSATETDGTLAGWLRRTTPVLCMVLKASH